MWFCELFPIPLPSMRINILMFSKLRWTQLGRHDAFTVQNLCQNLCILSIERSCLFNYFGDQSKPPMFPPRIPHSSRCSRASWFSNLFHHLLLDIESLRWGKLSIISDLSPHWVWSASQPRGRLLYRNCMVQSFLDWRQLSWIFAHSSCLWRSEKIFNLKNSKIYRKGITTKPSFGGGHESPGRACCKSNKCARKFANKLYLGSSCPRYHILILYECEHALILFSQAKSM